MNESESNYQRNLDQWQRLGESYTEKMIAIFEKNLEQAQVYQDQLYKAFTQVVDSQFNLAMSGFKALENQTVRLAGTFDEALKTEKPKK